MGHLTESYPREDVERLLGYYLHGGKGWRRPDAPDEDMPTAAGNPTQQNTEAAQMLDMDRAWRYCIEAGLFKNPAALWGYYHDDVPERAIAEVQGITQQAVSLHRFRDLSTLHQALNEGWRIRQPHPRYANYLKGALL